MKEITLLVDDDCDVQAILDSGTATLEYFQAKRLFHRQLNQLDTTKHGFKRILITLCHEKI